MNRLRTTKHYDYYGDFGETTVPMVNLQCAFKYKFLGRNYITWQTIFTIEANKLPMINNEESLLNAMTELWLNSRKESLKARLRQKVLRKLEYSK